VDDGLRPWYKHLLEMRPIKHVPSGGLLFLISLQLLHLRDRSVALFQGVPLRKATRRALTALSGLRSGRLCRLFLSSCDILRAEPKLHPRSCPSLPARRLTLQESAPFSLIGGGPALATSG
jgi:hypothetical protein